jgi:GGDEF domain-containing protein
MNLRQMAAWGQTHPGGDKLVELPNPERFLTLAVEGLARGVPEIDSETYKQFRSNVAKLALQLPDRAPEEEKLTQLRSIVREFGDYRKVGEDELRDRTLAWRSVTAFLFHELLKALGVDDAAARSDELSSRIAAATSAERIQNLRTQLDLFLHPGGADSGPVQASSLHTADHTTANDNAAGLRGGGSALEHLRRIMAAGGKAFIVLFRLSCLNMISQRFGPEAVEDCLMAVAAFLTQSLLSDDAVYHWSDSSLLAILEGRANEQILTAELERIVFQNRETTVNIGGRATMLRIPLTFDLTPVERLESPDDLLKITLQTNHGGSR